MMSVLDDYRLAPILDDPSLFGNASIDLFSLDLPPLQDASTTRPVPYDGAVNPSTPVRSTFDSVHHDQSRSAERRRGIQSTKNTAPIAEVLNYESPDSQERAQGNLFAWEFSPTKRRRVDDDRGTVKLDRIHLPEPPTQGAGPQQPSLPPLLQGLIEPPPDAGLFPPIQQHYDSGTWPWRGEASGKYISGEEERPERTSFERASQCSIEQNNESHTHDEQPETTAKVQDESQYIPRQAQVQVSKRNKWSARETADLCAGVAKHGKGRWQMILTDPTFKFDQRTAVDLKDRWRVQERKQGRQNRPPKFPSCADEPQTAKRQMHVSNILQSSAPAPQAEKHIEQGEGDKSSNAAACAKQKPSAAPNGSATNSFSLDEDAAILSGFHKWGQKWSYIQIGSDALARRSARDVRDRFRLKWPDRYAALGLKAGVSKRRGTANRENKRGQASEMTDPDCVDPAATWPVVPTV